ncbi:peptidase S8/S53 domain-containing protein [Mycena leptocephala]|nr:peptidase S8/S53 domain-containing protein [Mycena leptocephala]
MSISQSASGISGSMSVSGISGSMSASGISMSASGISSFPSGSASSLLPSSSASASVNASMSSMGPSPSGVAASCPVPSSSTRRKRTQQTQTDAAWALARIAQSAPLTSMGTDQNMPMDPALLQKFPGLVKLPARAGSQDWSFPYDDTWGEGVIVYVVDGGVKFDHEDLFGRVEEGHVIDRITDGKPATEDVCNHGTGVASLIAGTKLGIAKKATIVPVRIADEDTCEEVDSSTADAVAGVQWAIQDYQSRLTSTKCAPPKAGIINISWVYYGTAASEAALTSARAANMHVTIAAGNENENRCNGGPAPAEKQYPHDLGHFLVGNTDLTDRRMTMALQGATTAPGDEEIGSNFGPALEQGYFAAGTSEAAPLVAGAIAAFVGTNPQLAADPGAMRTFVVNKGVNPANIQDLQGSPDILLQTPFQSQNPQ